MQLRTPFCATLLAATAMTQGFTSPAGYVTTEGSSNHDYILFKYNDLRWQQLDQTSVGLPAVISRISWRRDATSAADATWIARTIDIEAVLSDSVPAGGISENYDANYVGTPTVVFARRPVNLPDWTQQPPTTPAPWDLRLQLDTPWVYMGLHPFLWELRITNNSSASDYGNDFQSMSGATNSANAGSVVGTGCIATGQVSPMALAVSVKNQISRFRLGFNVTLSTPSSPALLFIHGSNANLNITGLCAPLIALPTLVLSLGVSVPVGLIPEFAVDTIPYSANLVGGSFFSQALSVDLAQPGLPAVVSNGRQSTFPATQATPAAVTRVYGYRLPAGTMRAPSVWTGGIVTLFD